MKKQKNYPLYKVEKIESIKEMISKAVRDAKDKPAFIFKNDKKETITKTYQEFSNDLDALGTALNSIGGFDSHIAVIGDNSYKWITVYITILQSRGVCVPVDKELPPEEIINVLTHSDTHILFYSKKYEKQLDYFKENLPNVKYFIAFDKDEESDRVLSYDKLLAKGEELLKDGDTSYTSIIPNPDEMRVIVYTSGTTGRSKGVMIAEKSLVAIPYYGLQISNVYTRCLSVLPLHHTYEAAGLLFTLHKHACMCINENMKSVLKNLKLYKPDYMLVVPAFVALNSASFR